MNIDHQANMWTQRINQLINSPAGDEEGNFDFPDAYDLEEDEDLPGFLADTAIGHPDTIYKQPSAEIGPS